jgi:hypothetical protein
MLLCLTIFFGAWVNNNLRGNKNIRRQRGKCEGELALVGVEAIPISLRDMEWRPALLR